MKRSFFSTLTLLILGLFPMSEITGQCTPNAQYVYSQNQNDFSFFPDNFDQGVVFFWQFGDGSSSNIASPAHSYSVSGNFTVCLTVTDNCGTIQNCQVVNPILPPVPPQPSNDFVSSCNAAGASIDIPVLDNDGILNPASVTVSLSQLPTSGGFAFFQNDTLVYQPSPGFFGNDTIGYMICDSLSNCGSAFVFLNITNCNCIMTAAIGNISNSNCGNPDGTAEAFPINGMSPFSYQWSNGATTSTATNLAAGWSSVTITDANNCVAVDSAYIGNIVGISFSTTSVDEGCSGDSDGSISVVSSSGTPPFQYSIDNGATFNTSPDFLNLSGGDYFVVVQDNNGCSGQQLVSVQTTVNQSAAFTSSFNYLVGNFIATNQDTSYSYNWTFGDGGSSSQMMATHLYSTPGTYTVCLSITGPCGTLSQCDTLSTGQCPVNPTISFGVNSADPCLNSEGSVTAFGNGGFAPYSYVWENGSTNSTITNLHAGNYSLTLTDVNGCFVEDSVEITGFPSLVANITNTSASCLGGCDGALNISGSGGDGGYLYSINNGFSFQTWGAFINLCPGDYEVVVRDGNGCETPTDTLIISETTPADASFSFSQTGTTADFTSTFGGVQAVYSWTFGDGFISAVANPTHTYATPGVYQACLSVSTGCGTDSQCMSVSTAPQTPMAPEAQDDAVSVCNNNQATIINVLQNDSDPNLESLTISILSSATNGTSSISNGDISYTPNQGFFGTDLVQYVACDQGGLCDTASLTITINSCCPNGIINANVSTTPATCQNPGTATAAAAGGSPPYSYYWSNGENGVTALNLSAGNHQVSVTDINGCLNVVQFSVGGDPILFNSFVVDETCEGALDGYIALSVSGGIPPYQLSIDGGQTFQGTNTFPTLSAGTYDVFISDNSGCTVSGIIAVGGTPSADASFAWTSNGFTIDFSPNMATGSQQYLWDFGGGNTSNSAFSTFTFPGYGIYPVCFTVTNNCGSDISCQTIDLSIPQNPPVVGNENISSCSNSGQITLDLGTNDYDPESEPMTWTLLSGPSNGSASINGSLITIIPDSTYNGSDQILYQVCDTSGNCATGSVNLTTENCACTNPPLIVFDNVINENCPVLGSVEAIIMDGIPPYSIEWSNGANSNAISGLSAGSYSITVTDSVGCNVSGSVTIGNDNPLDYSVSVINESCINTSDGSIQITSLGGNGPLSYSIDGGGSFQTSSDFINLQAGIYSILVQDINGCGLFATEEVMVQGAPTVSFSANSLGLIAEFTPVYTGSGTTLFWDFGDQNFSSIDSPTHSFQAIGDYNVCVVATNSCGEASYCDTISIEELLQTPVAVNDPVNFCIDDTSFIINYGGNDIIENSGAVSSSLISGPSSGSASNIAFGLAEYFPNPGFMGNDSIWYSLCGPTGLCDTGLVVITIEECSNCDVPPSIEFVNIIPVHCGNSGSVNIQVIGGIPPFMYTWSNGQTTSGLTDLSIGQYGVTVVDANNCSVEDSIMIDETLQLLGSYTIQAAACSTSSNGSISLEAFGGMPPYSYSVDSGLTYSSSSILGGLSPGLYYTFVKDDLGCTYQQTAIVGYTGDVQANFGYTITDSMIHFINYSSPLDSNTTVNWNFGDMNTSSEWNPSHLFMDSALYTVCLNIESDCGSDSSCQDILWNLTDIETVDFESNFKVYPNPSKGKVYLEMNSFPRGEYSIELFDLSGKMISDNSITEIPSGAIELDFERFSKGLYILKLSGNGISIHKKIELK